MIFSKKNKINKYTNIMKSIFPLYNESLIKIFLTSENFSEMKNILDAYINKCRKTPITQTYFLNDNKSKLSNMYLKFLEETLNKSSDEISSKIRTEIRLIKLINEEEF